MYHSCWAAAAISKSTRRGKSYYITLYCCVMGWQHAAPAAARRRQVALGSAHRRRESGRRLYPRARRPVRGRARIVAGCRFCRSYAGAARGGVPGPGCRQPRLRLHGPHRFLRRRRLGRVRLSVSRRALPSSHVPPVARGCLPRALTVSAAPRALTKLHLPQCPAPIDVPPADGC